MSQMHPVLANAYGTLSGQQSQEEAEKVAAAQFIEKMAAADGINLNSLSDEQVTTVAQHYLAALEKRAAEEEEEKEPAEEPDEEKLDDEEKKAAAEMAEADFLGRMMAHSFVQELDGIQKQAAVHASAPAQPQEIPEAFLKLAEARAMQFLQEKVAANELCSCGDPNCNGDHSDKTASAQPEMSQQEYVDALAAQMLDQAGYGKFLR